MLWGTALLFSLTGNAVLYCFLVRTQNLLKKEQNKPIPEPRVIVETRVVEKPVPVSVNHVESRGMGGRSLSGGTGGFVP